MQYRCNYSRMWEKLNAVLCHATFRRGVFDRRFEEVFGPAISATGVEPYRVDRDPAAGIPIEAIEQGIRGAVVCFADISTDNPNVWFELGYAIAMRKEICLVCGSERKTKFPFDIQHRKVIGYDSGSPSDFAKLSEEIQLRLKAIITKQANLETIEAQPLKEGAGLSQHEIITLCSILENMYGAEDSTSIGLLRRDMEKLGYNQIATNLGLRKLLTKNFISSHEEEDFHGEMYRVYKLEEDGWRWVSENESRLNLRTSGGTTVQKNPDDDLPF